MDDFEIRPALPQDAEALSSLLEQIDLLSYDVLAPGTRYWLALDKAGALAGCIGMEFGREAVLLRSVAVRPEVRKQGLGRTLVEFALDQARQSGYRRAYLFSVRSGGYWQRMRFRTVPVEELTEALPSAPQVLRFKDIGKLARETGWRLDL
jgi:N-acetylglutamate synthase-like GNAT family acetyltransferase